ASPPSTAASPSNRPSMWIESAYLGAFIELTDERLAHIVLRHPELAQLAPELIAVALERPDIVGTRSGSSVQTAFVLDAVPEFSRGMLVVVVVSSDDAGGTIRHWVITAYVARRLSNWTIEWRRD
ncbi:MAG TPA: hypothetical protein VFK32_08980, partial [Tepidiformaceae bacterium]|nr:hypothetical protein [Tepidiformaceae bacterium]